MGLNRRQDSRFYSDKAYSQRAARSLLGLILKMSDNLLSVKGGDIKLKAAQGMAKQKENFTPKQLSYIDSIYESAMKGAGFESVNTHVDRKRRGAGL